MKLKLFLVYTLSLLSVACTDQLTPLEPEAQPTLLYVAPHESTHAITTDTNRKEVPKNTRPSIFGDLLVKLNLSREQTKIINVLLTKHKLCIENCISILKRAEREILIDAKVKENDIKSKLKAGEITQSEAREQLKDLKEKVNQALKLTIVKTNVKQCIISCDKEFLNELQRVLNSEQLIILEKWKTEKSKRG